MTALGSAIGPPPAAVMNQALNDAVEQMLREKGEAASLLRQVIESNERTAALLSQAASSLAAAALTLAAQAGAPAPIVNVTVPEPAETEAPIVNVTVEAPPVQIEVLPVERPAREVTTVYRDSNQLIERTETVVSP